MLNALIVCGYCDATLGCITIDDNFCYHIGFECLDCPIVHLTELEEPIEVCCHSFDNELSCIFTKCSFCQAKE